MYVHVTLFYPSIKCSRFRRIGTDNEFGVDDGLGLEWVQKEAQSSTFKIFKMTEKWSQVSPSIGDSEIIHSVEWDGGTAELGGAEAESPLPFGKHS